MPPNGSPTQNAVIIERLDRIQADLCKIQSRMDTQENDRIQFRESYLVGHTELEALAKETARTVAKHDMQIEALEEIIKPIALSNKIVSGVAALLGGSIILLIWQLLTGQAQVYFK